MATAPSATTTPLARDAIPESFISDSGEYTSSCGYCHSKHSSVAHGMQALRLSVYDYQRLIDRGWRRSGNWIYKLNMHTSCCKPYTIRLHAPSFQISKDQRRVLRRFDSFLNGKGHEDGMDEDEKGAQQEPKKKLPPSENRPDAINTLVLPPAISASRQALVEALDQAIAALVSQNILPALSFEPSTASLPPSGRARKALPNVVLTTEVAFKLFAAARKSSPPAFAFQKPDELAERLCQQVANSLPGGLTSAYAQKGHIHFCGADGLCKEVEETLAQAAREAKARAKDEKTHITLSPSSSRKRKEPEQQPTTASAADASNAGTSEAKTTTQRSFTMTLQPSSFIEEEYELYRRYQMAIHHDPPSKMTPTGYRHFLVDSPFELVTRDQDPSAPSCGYGAFHQQYRVDGKLIAVGVIDILPSCLSSKYFFWDPDYKHLALGKFSSLKEIEQVRDLAASSPSLQYYYMGYYIHTCPKMRYKGEYRPSDLLCPKSFAWYPLERVVHLIDATPYVEFCETPDAGPGIGGEDTLSFNVGRTLLEVKLLKNHVLYTLPSYIQSGEYGKRTDLAHLRSCLETWVKVVGPDLATRLVYVL